MSTSMKFDEVQYDDKKLEYIRLLYTSVPKLTGRELSKKLGVAYDTVIKWKSASWHRDYVNEVFRRSKDGFFVKLHSAEMFGEVEKFIDTAFKKANGGGADAVKWGGVCARLFDLFARAAPEGETPMLDNRPRMEINIDARRIDFNIEAAPDEMLRELEDVMTIESADRR